MRVVPAVPVWVPAATGRWTAAPVSGAATGLQGEAARAPAPALALALARTKRPAADQAAEPPTAASDQTSEPQTAELPTATPHRDHHRPASGAGTAKGTAPPARPGSARRPASRARRARPGPPRPPRRRARAGHQDLREHAECGRTVRGSPVDLLPSPARRLRTGRVQRPIQGGNDVLPHVDISAHGWGDRRGSPG